MLLKTPPMGWNSWNTFGGKINEALILEMADAMVDLGYQAAGYEYVIIDDCWASKERNEKGELVPDPEKFPHGMKYLSDYIHSKGLKFGMYSCAGIRTCADYPSSYGYEYIDAATFAAWGVDYLKYDFCFFPSCGDGKNAYLTMAQALRSTGRDIVFAACNWGSDDPATWIRSHGGDTWRSTGDICDNRKSFMDIFVRQYNNFEGSAVGCYNDMDMLIVGMHGVGHTSLGGCTDEEYLLHFALWAFFGSPLIIGGDIRNLDEPCRKTLQNKGLISIHQDPESRPPCCVSKNWDTRVFFRFLSDGEFAVALFNPYENNAFDFLSLGDIGIHLGDKQKVEFTDVLTGEKTQAVSGSLSYDLPALSCKILRGKILHD